MITAMKKANNFQVVKVQSQGLAQLFFANFSMVFFIKVLLIKKVCNCKY